MYTADKLQTLTYHLSRLDIFSVFSQADSGSSRH